MNTKKVFIAVKFENGSEFSRIVESRNEYEKMIWITEVRHRGDYTHFEIEVKEDSLIELFEVGFRYGSFINDKLNFNTTSYES